MNTKDFTEAATTLKVAVYSQSLLLNVDKLTQAQWTPEEKETLKAFNQLLEKKLEMNFSRQAVLLAFEKHFQTLEYLYDISLILFKLPKADQIRINNSLDFNLKKYAPTFYSTLGSTPASFHHHHDQLKVELKQLSTIKR